MFVIYSKNHFTKYYIDYKLKYFISAWTAASIDNFTALRRPTLEDGAATFATM
jgi:hypothetical protein